MRKIFGILIALALVLSFSLVAVPAGADEPHQNTVESSTMIFEGGLTDEGGGVYTGTIAMTAGGYYISGGAGESISTSGGFDVYAKEAGCAYCLNYYGTGAWNCDGTDTYIVGYYAGTNHDAYPLPGGPWGSWYNPDCADWNQYSLELTADHWYLRYTATGESPMSGVMYWYGDDTGYAAETDKGTLDSNDDGVVDGVYDLGGPAMWDWNAGAQVERIPLEYPGFAVQVTPGSYTVTLTPAEGPVENLNTSVTYGTIQLAVDAAGVGHTLAVAAGTYVEVGQIVINKDLTIIGENKDTTIIKPDPGFTDSYLFRVNAGEFNLSNVTLDGDGNLYGGVRYTAPGTGTLDNNIFKNIVFPSYTGIGVVVYADDVVVSNNIFTNIGRVGIWVGADNVLVTGNTYAGKGEGDWLDYGIEVGYGGVATITDNTITNCKGVASSDGSTSAGILVTTYYGSGTTATITGNTLTGNTGGIGVGYDDEDTSTVVAHYNNINGNTDYGIDTTASVVDALYNWWGDETGPSHDLNLGGQGDAVSDNVDFSPWLYKTQEQFVPGAPCYAGSVVLENEAAEVDPGSYAGGWNSFSTPITLDGSADTVSELLALTTGSGLFIERAMRFDLASQTWVPVIMGNVVFENYQIKPGEGLFIQVRNKGSLPILVNTTITSPPQRNLVVGWNLIGMSSLGAQTVATALSGVSYSVVLSPVPPNDVAWSVPPSLPGVEYLQLGEAYWVAMGAPGILFGFTTTPVAVGMTWELNQ